MTEQTGTAKDPMGFLHHYLVDKAPFQIPDGGREWIVKFGPWIILVVMVLALPAILFVLGLGTIALPFAGVAYATGFSVGVIGLFATFVLQALALPGLFSRRMSGWTLLFYAQTISAASGLLQGAVASSLIGALISFYILFQVRSLYK